MKTVGLLTMHRVARNCGSCLQTLATVKAIERLGHDCTVIDYLYPTAYHKLHTLGNDFNRGGRLRRLLGRIGILDYVRVLKLWVWQWQDRKRLARFLASFKHTKPVKRRDFSQSSTFNLQPLGFDVYVTGSDQTWNARYLAEDHTFLLDFVPDGVRKVSYAASFGGNEVHSAYRADYARLLSRYDAISVREASGVDIVCDLTGKTATWVADPTLLLTADEWRPMERITELATDRFVFCYVLSYFDPGAWFVDAIKSIATKLDAGVIFYTDGLRLQEAQKAGFTVLTGTLLHEEFLGYVDRAAFVVTTSFHGTAFAVNFRKDFFSSINSKSASDSRVGSFLTSVGLRHRGLSDSDELPQLMADLHVDYGEADDLLNELRHRSLEYLKSSLEGSRG